MSQVIDEEIRKGNKDRRLTLDEMYDIFMGDAYKEFRDQTHNYQENLEHVMI